MGGVRQVQSTLCTLHPPGTFDESILHTASHGLKIPPGFAPLPMFYCGYPPTTRHMAFMLQGGLRATEPEKPIGANQVSEPLLLGTNITRDELFLPDNPLFLTAHPSPENPERAALYFVSGVCIGLVLTLAALVMRISCHTDCRQRPRKKFLQDRENSSDSSDSEDGSSDTASDISVRRHRRFERTLNKNVFTSAEELERAQRLEERERIIREIWMNGQPEVPGTRSLNRYY
ncbi:protein eva-1 homolog A [Callorhinus ursinus]|uniref:protein eva-1 homolog A n=1 Tax=Callorhinus ursinus TaxID=34884 RepID=UPI003CD02835